MVWIRTVQLQAYYTIQCVTLVFKQTYKQYSGSYLSQPMLRNLYRSIWTPNRRQFIAHMNVAYGTVWEDLHILLARVSWNRSTITDFPMCHINSWRLADSLKEVHFLRFMWHWWQSVPESAHSNYSYKLYCWFLKLEELNLVVIQKITIVYRYIILSECGLWWTTI